MAGNVVVGEPASFNVRAMGPPLATRCCFGQPHPMQQMTRTARVNGLGIVFKMQFIVFRLCPTFAPAIAQFVIRRLKPPTASTHRKAGVIDFFDTIPP